MSAFLRLQGLLELCQQPAVLCCTDLLHKKKNWLSWCCLGSRTPCAASTARPPGQLRIGLQLLTRWLSTGGCCGRVLCVVTDVTISYKMCKSTHLTQSILACGHPLPELLTRDRLPEAAMEHAMRAVATDCQVKRWKPHPCSKWELLYSYAQRQIDCNSLEGKARQPSSPPNLLGPCIR